MNSFAISRTGHGKQKNEDSFAHCVSHDGRVSFYMIADGMGGYVYGDFASKLTVEILKERIDTYEYDCKENLEAFLKDSITLADDRIKKEIESDVGKKDMGSTIIVLAYVKEQNLAVFCNAGDSKGYVYSENIISFVTHDHSVAQLMIDKGYTEEETKRYLKENSVTKAVGYFAENELAECYEIEVKIGDVLLLCSDGFYRGLEQTEIGWLIKENYYRSSEEMCSAFVYDALGRESTDDITVIVIKI